MLKHLLNVKYFYYNLNVFNTYYIFSLGQNVVIDELYFSERTTKATIVGLM